MMIVSTEKPNRGRVIIIGQPVSGGVATCCLREVPGREPNSRAWFVLTSRDQQPASPHSGFSKIVGPNPYAGLLVGLDKTIWCVRESCKSAAGEFVSDSSHMVS